jgi:beta-phosphoglucomutase-like phosphatase (HAD superfamily)
VTGQLGHAPQRCAAVEDSANGLRSAAAAGLHVIAVPHPRYPPGADALGLAALVLPSLAGLTPEAVSGLDG